MHIMGEQQRSSGFDHQSQIFHLGGLVRASLAVSHASDLPLAPDIVTTVGSINRVGSLAASGAHHAPTSTYLGARSFFRLRRRW